ncbi:MAG: cupin domain-containing protein [Planctomycetota bacterium]|jgi:quercetin dioxygenase-like cupin family protein
MLIRRASEMEGKPVPMEGASGVSMRMMVGRDDGAPTFSMRHFTVEPGGHTPRHQHNYEHEVFIVSGRGRIEQAGEIEPIKSGDVVFVQPNAVHQFVNDSDAPLTFLCLVPVSFDCAGQGLQPVPGS